MELAEMKEIHRDALAGKETIKSKLAKFEQEIFGAKRTRDKALNTMKKQAEKQKDIAEKAEKRVVRATLQTMDDTNDPRMQSRIDKDNLVKIFEYEDSVRSIMDAISISDVEDILHRVVDQQNTSTHLQEQTEFLAKQLVLLKTRKANILKEFESMKYSGERKTVNSQTLVNKMENRLVDEMKRSQVVSEDLTRKEQVMVKTCTGVESLYHKLLSVKLPPPQRSYAVDGDALDQLGLIEKKLQILLDLLKLKDSNIVRKILAGIEFQEYMENILPAENVRIQIQEEETYVTSGLDYDSQDNEDTLTREDIKNRGQKILEKKTRKRGRKRKN
uniref:Uncharacterized protein LOC102805762 n=1 Tax=Saccoglossus kowalevskii TaxID=10224 RepID=A0ABM0M8V6_SACKO|nr:PREDICTED: uncharacterized protein LOC102805762 [Saccoglossus kowalevskii]